jgi:hypothetical protein
MYYPHWQATVNGSSAATSEIGGALAVDVPGEESIIELRFVEPRYTSISRWISLLAWSAVGLAAVTLKLRKRSPLT